MCPPIYNLERIKGKIGRFDYFLIDCLNQVHLWGKILPTFESLVNIYIYIKVATSYLPIVIGKNESCWIIFPFSLVKDESSVSHTVSWRLVVVGEPG